MTDRAEPSAEWLKENHPSIELLVQLVKSSRSALVAAQAYCEDLQRYRKSGMAPCECVEHMVDHCETLSVGLYATLECLLEKLHRVNQEIRQHMDPQGSTTIGVPTEAKQAPHQKLPTPEKEQLN